ncbi:MAG: hypothetical protein OXH00_08505 [Candidatus Poribacteria bacterium]|nr:hypothetical protein [Candidatus Poribacteria bacterium]
MTNTLTWDIKPLAFLKINTNLLSTISFFVLCVMLFTAAPLVQMADAGEFHWIPAYKIHGYFCSVTGELLFYDILDTGWAKAEHGADDDHSTFPDAYIEIASSESIPPEECWLCTWYSLWTSS